ncbi:hypothetical protein VCHE46_2325A, partial [Vibrio cholerae HE-46]
MSIDTLCDWG